MLTPARIGMPRRLCASPRATAAVLLLSALGFGGCAQSPQQIAASSHGKEYFPSSTYGRASRRVIADGQPIPHGGGQYLVGKPYTVAGQTYVPSERHIVQVGLASWYGDAFHGRLTANGEIYDRDSFSAAHPTMPLPSYARVTNLSNHYSMIVRVNDRGPYAANRIMDVSRRVADALDFQRSGTAKVKVEYVGPASLAGSDDSRLYATLRQDGPARWHGEAPTMVAERRPVEHVEVASLAPEAPERVERVAHHVEPVEELPHPTRREALARDAETLAHMRIEDHRHADATMAAVAPRRGGAMAHRDTEADQRAARFAVAELRHAPLPPARLSRERDERVVLPPSRPVDLGRLRGASNETGRRHAPGLRLARARDD